MSKELCLRESSTRLYTQSLFLRHFSYQHTGKEMPFTICQVTTKFYRIRNIWAWKNGVQPKDLRFLHQGQCVEDFHTGEMLQLKEKEQIH
jgi:hypothetical protein